LLSLVALLLPDASPTSKKDLDGAAGAWQLLPLVDLLLLLVDGVLVALQNGSGRRRRRSLGPKRLPATSSPRSIHHSPLLCVALQPPFCSGPSI